MLKRTMHSFPPVQTSEQSAPCAAHSQSTNNVSMKWQVFRILCRLHPTPTGPDQLPGWFLRLGAPVFRPRTIYISARPAN